MTELYFVMKINVMKLDIIDDGIYLVQIKTMWIKLVQRHWKKVIRIRKENMVKRMNDILREVMTTGKRKRKNYYYPTLKGMLYEYDTNRKEKYTDYHLINSK